MTYIQPEQVISPKSRLRDLKVISAGAEWEWALAEAFWDAEEDGNCKPCLMIRWNGGTGREKGNPVSSSYPVWFILPEALEAAAKTAAAKRDAKSETRRPVLVKYITL